MKSVFDMKGPERAAALLVALGPEVAADILRQLKEEDIELLTSEMAKINGIKPTEKEELIGEFLIDLKKGKAVVEGGEGMARDLLSRAFGADKAQEVIEKLNRMDVVQQYQLLEELDPEVIARILHDEMPQTIAVALSHLSPKQSGQVLKNLDGKLAADVSLRIARLSGVTPETATRVAQVIHQRCVKYVQEKGAPQAGEGLESLVDILNNMSGSDELRFMRNIEQSNPELSDMIRDHIFTFENVVNLDNSEIRILIDEISNDLLIATALKGAGDEIRFKFLRNTSRNRATDILDEMEAMGPVKLSQVEEARSEIVGIMRYLSDNGVISLVRDREIFVE